MGARGALVATAFVIAGCGGGAPALPAAPNTIELSAPDFKDGAAVPKVHTCEGAGRPPALAWRAVPAGAAELVLVVEDPDASFTHWTAYGIPPTASGLPAGTKSGENSAGEEGWTPPCPPEGDDPHHYTFALYALDHATGLEPGAEPKDVIAKLDGALARGAFTGTYQRR